MRIAFQIKNNKILNLAPAKIIVLSFASLIFIGAILLTLPIMSNSGKSTAFADALFTATSATCVTGLVVFDTFDHWSIWGQLVILAMIQVGGLGLVTFATFFSVLLGRKVGLKGMMLVQESLNHFTVEGVIRLLKRVVLVTFTMEALGAALLSSRFLPRFGLRGIYMGVFHAVSAFCNAGFDIMGGYKSFTEYNNDPVVLFTLCALVITGGLGFIVWRDLYEIRRNNGLYLHTKVVLTVTAVLIVAGAIFFYIAERNNPATMGSLSFFEKVNSAVFHSVMTRTAGFNSLPLDVMHEISKVGTIILMFIGGAPGSTAGGIKVTTFSVIIIAVISQIKGSDETIIFSRRVPHYIVTKSLSIIVLGLLLVIVVTILMLGVGETKYFIDLLYEATSAFGTVGLSAASTPTLTQMSRYFLIITMFLGRVGPLSFAIALTLRSRKNNSELVYPEGKIVVG